MYREELLTLASFTFVRFTRTFPEVWVWSKQSVKPLVVPPLDLYLEQLVWYIHFRTNENNICVLIDIDIDDGGSNSLFIYFCVEVREVG